MSRLVRPAVPVTIGAWMFLMLALAACSPMGLVSTNPPRVTTESIEPPMRIVAYFTSWGTYTRKYMASDVPASSLTHLNYAFAGVSADGVCASMDAQADRANLPALRELKQQNPQLRTLISIGGATGSKHFSEAARTADARQRLAESCVRFMRDAGFDGLDIDWEYPSGADDKRNFTALLAELRQQLDMQARADHTQYLLTIAAPAGQQQLAGFDLRQLATYADWINLMAYDFAGNWSRVTGFNAPLHAASESATRPSDSVDAAVQSYLAAGVPPNKLVLGVSFYGVGWKGVPNRNHGLYQQHAGQPRGTFEKGSFAYDDLTQNYLQDYARFWEDVAQSPWIYNAAAKIMISYDDPQSLGVKAGYIKANKLGGVMIWELSGDDAQHSLLNALRSGLH